MAAAIEDDDVDVDDEEEEEAGVAGIEGVWNLEGSTQHHEQVIEEGPVQQKGRNGSSLVGDEEAGERAGTQLGKWVLDIEDS